VFVEPQVDFRVLAASLFTSNDAPEMLLAKLEALAQRMPVILALVSDEEPDRIALLKNPKHFDSMTYGFTGANGRNLAAVHIPASAFENSAPYNVLDDAVTIWTGLDTLPPDQYFHAYVTAGTQNKMNLACKRCLVIPMQWYQDVASNYPDGIAIKEFHDRFLAPSAPADRPALSDVFTWWRHAASCSAVTTVRAHWQPWRPSEEVLPKRVVGHSVGRALPTPVRVPNSPRQTFDIDHTMTRQEVGWHSYEH
jgi:hypothetical protein